MDVTQPRACSTTKRPLVQEDDTVLRPPTCAKAALVARLGSVPMSVGDFCINPRGTKTPI